MLSLDGVHLPLAHFELDVSFETRAAATGIFGPSGAGKTTILELIAGVRRPRAGRVLIDDVLVNDVPARKRGVGYVPQGESLFPHMTVERNIRFGVRDDRIGVANEADQCDEGDHHRKGDAGGMAPQKVLDS